MLIYPAESVPQAGELLAERLERGPLALPSAIQCAYEIAKALREMHRYGQAHGAVNCRAIVLRPAGADLLAPPGGGLPIEFSGRDLQGFGWVLQSLFPSEPPPAPHGAPDAAVATGAGSASGMTAAEVWSAARRVAQRSVADAPEAGWNMQHALNELRLLRLSVGLWESAARKDEIAARPMPTIWRAQDRDPGGLAPPVPTLPRAAAPPPVTPSFALPGTLFFAPAPQPTASGVRCPRCRAPYVHLSTPRTDFESTLELFHMPVMRCHRCSYRFFKFLRMTITKYG